MDRRLLLGLGVAAIIVIAGAGLLLSRGATPSASGSATPSPVALASVPPASVAAASPSRPDASASAVASAAGSSPAPSPTCGTTTRLVAVRAAAPDTGFALPVRWTRLGPAGDLFFTLSDVTPEIPLDGSGPASIRIGLGYMTRGDRIAFTASSVTLAYDPATGNVTGDVDTGYGKNSNRATTDTVPSPFTGHLQRPDASGANGVFTGSIAHRAREFAFRVPMAERTIEIAVGLGCVPTTPSDAP